MTLIGRSGPAVPVLLCVAAAGCADGRQGGAPAAPALYRLDVGEHAIEVELAVTDDARARGLMFREDLPPGRGMLFIFDPPRPVTFWMKNTFVPLDAVYADETGRVFQIERMEPRNLEGHESSGPARYVLEVPAGWCAAHGVSVGAMLRPSEPIRRVPVE